LDGYQENCVVHHNNEEYACEEARHLYAGDKVIKKPAVKALKIKWAPYAREIVDKTDKTSLTVFFEPPKDKDGIIQQMKELLSFVKTDHEISIAASRIVPMDGFNKIPPKSYNYVTLIPGQKTIFAWPNSNGGYILCKDNANKKLLKKYYGADTSLELSPEQMGMRLGDTYTCITNEKAKLRQFKLRLLSADFAQQIATDLMKIEKDNPTYHYRSIQKALYLQFVSDIYPQDVDLYWLSFIELRKTTNDRMLTDDDRILLDELGQNYLNHNTGGM
jgi:hypothetical protein